MLHTCLLCAHLCRPFMGKQLLSSAASLNLYHVTLAYTSCNMIKGLSRPDNHRPPVVPVLNCDGYEPEHFRAPVGRGGVEDREGATMTLLHSSPALSSTFLLNYNEVGQGPRC